MAASSELFEAQKLLTTYKKDVKELTKKLNEAKENVDAAKKEMRIKEATALKASDQFHWSMFANTYKKDDEEEKEEEEEEEEKEEEEEEEEENSPISEPITPCYDRGLPAYNNQKKEVLPGGRGEGPSALKRQRTLEIPPKPF